MLPLLQTGQPLALPGKVPARSHFRDYEAEEEDNTEFEDASLMKPPIARGMPRRATSTEDDEEPLGMLSEGGEGHLRPHTVRVLTNISKYIFFGMMTSPSGYDCRYSSS